MAQQKNWWEQAKFQFQKIQKFLHSRTSYTKFSQATSRVRKMTAFARLGNNIWFMDLAFVQKFEGDNLGVNYLVVRQNMLDRRIIGGKKKTKVSKKFLRRFQERILRETDWKKWLFQGTDIAGDLKRVLKQIPQLVTQSEKSGPLCVSEKPENNIYRYLENHEKNLFTSYLNLLLPQEQLAMSASNQTKSENLISCLYFTVTP